VSGITLKSLHCVSCIVIHSYAPFGHRAQLQGELVLGHAYGDRHTALEGLALVSASIISYASHPL
jgi:hypothetical protein